MIKSLLAVSCSATLAATAYLSLSLIILNPPRANFPVWFSLAAVLVAQSLATLVAINMAQPPAALRTAVAGGALVLFVIAVWRVGATLDSSHFEGYNLLLAAILVVQAAFTLAAVGRPQGLRYQRPTA